MSFFLGMAADLAAQHGHEFTPPASNSARSSPQSINPFPPPTRSSFKSTKSPPANRPNSSSSVNSSATTRNGPTVMFADQEHYSVGGLSRSNSTSSVVSIGSGKKVPRSKTSYQLCHPPKQTHRQRLNIRPRLLMQLQRLSSSSRPVPAFDVLPSTLFAPRLARKFPRFFKGKNGLGVNDLVIMTSEEYASPHIGEDDVSITESDEDGLDRRQVIATISQLSKDESGRRGRTEICLNQGPTWEATLMANGGYEFVARDEKEGTLTARWIPRMGIKRRTSGFQGQQRAVSASFEPDEKKFNFSMINPNTRRHPIIASMTKQRIDILDQYSTASSSTANLPPVSPVWSASSSSGAMNHNTETPERVLTKTDERMKTLIMITGIWVAFREGWSQNFRYVDSVATPLASSSPTTLNGNASGSERRSMSLPLTNCETSRSGRPEDSEDSSHNSIGGKILRRGSQLIPLRTTTTPLTPTSDSDMSLPRRANSTGGTSVPQNGNRNRSHMRRASQMAPAPVFGDSESDLSAAVSTPTRAPSGVPLRSVDMGEQRSGSPSPLPRTNPHRRVQSAYYPAPPAEFNVPGAAAAQNGNGARGVEAERRRWGKLRSLFNFIKRTSGVNQ